MCGIAGFVDKKNSLSHEAKRALLTRMLSSIKHRGPDADGIWLREAVGMAHARLSILDLSSAANQPMWNEDETIGISFNGEIYNHLQVRKDLPSRQPFRTHSDTETILYSYEAWREACLPKLKGMFAFSIVDTSHQELFLALDRFAIKPLYYLDTPEWFAWSSEAKTLLLLPHFERALSAEGLGEYLLFRSLAGPGTLFKHIRKLLPGEYMTYSLGSNALKVSRYYNPRHAGEILPHSHHEEHLGSLLRTSVQEHLLADVPVGVQLSGGLDSSIVSALVSENMPPGQKLHSFSIGLADAEWNEFPHSRRVSELLGTVHHELQFTEEDFCKALPQATYHYDEPLNHSHSIPMMFLAQKAKDHVKVLISGEGADEIFGGYTRYSTCVRDRRTESILLSNAFSSLEQVRAVLKNPSHDLSHREKILADTENEGPERRLASYDLATYLPSLLLRQDKMGMKSGLENRVPFLDHVLVETALQLPIEDKISTVEGKILLKKIAEKYLPYDIVHRKKVGFGQPIASWMRNEKGLGSYLSLLTKPAIERDYINYDAVRRMVDEHQRGSDHSRILWTLLMLEVWSKMFIDVVPYELVWESLQR